jgi:Velvet factor
MEMTYDFAGSSSLHAGSHHASPIGAGAAASSLQQNPIWGVSWGPTGLSQYPVPPLSPSSTAPLYTGQGISRSSLHSGDMTTDPCSETQPLSLGYPHHAQGPTVHPPSNTPYMPIGTPTGTTQGMPLTGQNYPYGPTAGPPQPGPSAHPSGQYAPIDPSGIYETLIGTSISVGNHIKDDQGQTNVLFVFGDLSVRTEGTFSLRLRLSNVGQ